MFQTTTALNSSSTLSTTPTDPLATTTTTSLTTEPATSTINRSSATTLAATTTATATTPLSTLNWTSATNGWGTVEKNRSNGEQGAADGRVLTLNGTTYNSGLGVHANSEITYKLNGQYTRFISDIGLDDEVGNLGSTVFQVWADNAKIYDSSLMTGSSVTKTVDVDLTGKQTLRLVVTDGGDGDSFDHADWANARLLGGGAIATTTTTSEVNLSSLSWTTATNGWGTVENNRSNGEQGAADGRTITLNGIPYTSGLGVHANSDITYNLNGQYTRFRSDVGVDDEVGSNGSVAFQVWADGTKLYDSGVMTGISATKAVDVDLTGKQALRLVVTDGGDGSSFDHADWANARLLGGGSSSTTDLNDRPTISLIGGNARSISQNGSLAITGLTIADPDAGTGALMVTVQVTNGQLTINGNVSGGVPLTSITNNGTGNVTLTGTLTQINATLANATGLTYRPNAGYQGTDGLNITVNDNGNTGSGGALTATQSLAIAISSTPTYPNANSPIGINLSSVDYYMTSWPFVDVFKINSGWISQRDGTGWGGGGALNLRSDGYIASLQPGQYADILMYYDSDAHFPGGNYTILYEGEGRLEFMGDTVVSQTPGRMVINVVPDQNGIYMRLAETNPANPIHNIRVIMPGFENTYQTQPFHPLFLERLAPFKVLRFMDWEQTNSSPVDEWSDRTTTNSFNQSSKNGVALEHMIQLANTLHTDPWFNIPHAADDNYVRQFATMVRDQLDPTLKVRIEYSNEVWNYAYGFSQTQYAQQKGLELGLTTDPIEAPWFYYAKRAVEVFKIFEEVFGGTDRLVRVLASQASNPYVGEKVLTWQNAYQHADEYAIAPYFSIEEYGQPARFNELMSMTSTQIIDQVLMQDINTNVRQYITDGYNLAQRYGLTLVAYEGGSDMTTSALSATQEPLATAKLIEVSRNPHMQDAYRSYLEMWENIGGGMFNQFSDVFKPQKWGQWGLLEYQDQPLNMAPEYQSVIDYIQQNPRPGL